MGKAEMRAHEFIDEKEETYTISESDEVNNEVITEDKPMNFDAKKPIIKKPAVEEYNPEMVKKIKEVAAIPAVPLDWDELFNDLGIE